MFVDTPDVSDIEGPINENERKKQINRLSVS